MKERKEKFVVDQMYQRLARRLRVLGYDTVIGPVIPDESYLVIADTEKRILLSRDEELNRNATKLGIKAFNIDAPSLEERLVNLHNLVGIELTIPDDLVSRCSVCNSEIKTISKEDIDDKIPEETKKHYNQFWICKNEECQQIYWKGSHWEKIAKSVEKCKRIIAKQS